MLISLASLGMDRMELRDSIREGYTPLNAESFYESEVMRQFSDASGREVPQCDYNTRSITIHDIHMFA